MEKGLGAAILLLAEAKKSIARDWSMLRSTAFGAVSKSLGALAALSLNVLIGRTMGAEGLGIFAIGLSVVAVLSIFGALGHPYKAVRFAAPVYDQGRIALLGGWARRWAFFSFFCGIILSILAFNFLPLLKVGVFDNPDLIPVVQLMAVAAPFIALNLVNAGLLKASGRPVLGIQLETAAQWILFLMILCVFLFLFRDLPIKAIGIGYLSASFLVSIFGIFILRNIYFINSLRELAYFPQEYHRAAREFTMVQLSSYAQMWFPMLIIGAFLDLDQVGKFNAAMRCAMLFLYLTVAFGGIIPARLAIFYENGDISGLENTSRKMTAYILFISAPLLVVFLFFPSLVMSLFGDDFTSASILLVILAIGRAIFSIGTSAQFLLLMSGNEHLVRKIMVEAAIMVSVLCFILVQIWGAIGAALAVSISAIFQATSCVILAYKRMGICTIPGLKKRGI